MTDRPDQNKDQTNNPGQDDTDATGDLTVGEQATLALIDRHLGDADLWEPPALDGQFRLLAAAQAELDRAKPGAPDGPTVSATSAGQPATQSPPTAAKQPTALGQATAPDQPTISRPGAGEVVSDASADRWFQYESADDGSEVIELLQRRGARRQRLIGFGAATVLAGAAAVGLFLTSRLHLDPTTGTGNVKTATYELAATSLDPDATASVDVAATPSGVEFILDISGLDNATGDDYYAVWLTSNEESVPLGTFHWRKGGTDIIVWSGVDDPTYNRITVTRQVKGDGGARSDAVVLMGEVPDLTD